MAETPGAFSVQPQKLAVWGRASMLALVAVLLTTSDRPWVAFGCWSLLLITALPAFLTRSGPGIVQIGRIAEVLVVGIAAAFTPGALGASMPYLVAPVFAASISVGVWAGLSAFVPLLGLGTAVALIAGIASGVIDQSAYLVQCLEWVAISAAIGFVGASIRTLSETRARQLEPDYVQATRLLTQLRTIARQLPGTLDPGSIAERLLDELRGRLPGDRAAVFTASGGGRLEVLAQKAPDRVAWEVSLDADTPIAEAWASQQPQVWARTLAREQPQVKHPISTLVLPLITGVRTVGLVVMEADKAQAYSSTDLATATSLAAPVALRLETALLFDEVRSIATTEERQRLAREIHDGVAQELVMVGYGIDNAIAELPVDAEVTQSLHALRAEVTRVITELRLSLFELRTGIDRHSGLGTAVSEYARAIGSSAGLRVHISLDESTARLPAAVEAELLRIAQEAITNARKHSGALNLWVSCEVDPPYARIEIADDGAGIPELKRRTAITTDRGKASAGGSFGLSIMTERAARIRAILTIAPRSPQGTIVSVALGGSTPARRGSVSAEGKGAARDGANNVITGE